MGFLLLQHMGNILGGILPPCRSVRFEARLSDLDSLLYLLLNPKCLTGQPGARLTHSQGGDKLQQARTLPLVHECLHLPLSRKWHRDEPFLPLTLSLPPCLHPTSCPWLYHDYPRDSDFPTKILRLGPYQESCPKWPAMLVYTETFSAATQFQVDP